MDHVFAVYDRNEPYCQIARGADLKSAVRQAALRFGWFESHDEAIEAMESEGDHDRLAAFERVWNEGTIDALDFWADHHPDAGFEYSGPEQGD